MNRRQAREYAFKLIYEYGVQTDKPVSELISDTSAQHDFQADNYILSALNCVAEKKEDFDKKISDNSLAWKIGRISPTSLAIMRLSVFEMLYAEDVPFNVSINEAVELAKKYDHEKAPKFINGILNAIAEKEGLKSTVGSSKIQPAPMKQTTDNSSNSEPAPVEQVTETPDKKI